MGTLADRDVLEVIVRKFKDLTAEFELDVDEIGAQTALKDLGVRSISLIFALAELQDHFGLGDQLLAQMLVSGVPIDEHRVADLVRFVLDASESHVDHVD